MLDIFITSKIRFKLLIKFFICDGVKSYLRKMEKEFNESSNAIRIELNRLLKAGLLVSEYEGKKRYYMANVQHPLYDSLKSVVRQSLGIDQIVAQITTQVRNIEAAYITDNITGKTNSDIIELLLVGQKLNESTINPKVKKTEKIIDRKIKYACFTPEQMQFIFKKEPDLLIWEKNSCIE